MGRGDRATVRWQNDRQRKKKARAKRKTSPSTRGKSKEAK